ncbi:hypothetical protein DXG01_003655 [Tephrocybe rancida]|nr:hypothetical protein DXG01_003655 [Tephrocybe rancida]
MRFPSSPSSAARDVDFNEGPDGQPNNLTTNVNEAAKPTRREYASEAAKGFLSILEDVARAVPVPGLSIVVKLALNIIKACEESHATLEQAQELKLRIKGLVLTLVNELKGKKEGEIRAQMVQDIGTLQREFHIIEMQLNEIASQHRFLLLISTSLNNNKQNTQTLNEVYAGQQQNTQTLSEVHTSVADIQLSMVDVKAILTQGSPAHTTSSPMRALIPANTHIFHGRDTLVTKLVGVLVGGSRQHICLLGPGGMGKTSTSLAVMNHPDVEARFAEHLRVWVPCVKAPSTSLLFDTLCTSLGISIKSGNPLSDILSVLRTSPPIVLVLDNFETPWNAAEGQSSSSPCEDLPWHRVDLRAVDATAARDIYISWHPKGNEDPGLPDLLKLIGHMPLAITLMAKFAASNGLSAKEVAEEYKAHGTVMMGQGLDAKTSMDVCIGLSVNSPRMTAHPEAFELLCTIARDCFDPP